MKVELVTYDSGEWEVLKLKGKEYVSGHRLYNGDWVNLLREIGIEVIETELVDDELRG